MKQLSRPLFQFHLLQQIAASTILCRSCQRVALAQTANSVHPWKMVDATADPTQRSE
jgi:hypothetical protein